MAEMKIHKGPWLVPAAVATMEQYLSPGMAVFETGAGGSTFWFADRAASVLSYEHSAPWHAVIKRELAKRGTKNVTLVLAPSYPTKGFDLPENAFDIVLVDGRGRVRTVETIWKSLKPGGLLILDNSERERYRPIFEFLRGKTYAHSRMTAEWETTIWWKNE